MLKTNASLIAIGLLALAGAAHAQDQTPAQPQAPAGEQAQQSQQEADPVVATIDDQEIRLSEVQAAMADLPEQYQQMPFQMIYGPLLDRVIDARLLAGAAEEADLEEQPGVQAALESARARVLSDALIRTRINEGITDEKLQAKYEERQQDPSFEREEVHARHILLESEEEAKEVIEELKGGADFAELAEERSTGPSGPQGGDLGYFTREQMVPEFAEAAFNLEPDQITEEPVETQFGWHVIKVEDKRTVEPSLEEVEPELRQELAREIVTALLEDLRSGAEIERFGPDGNPLPEEGAAGEQAPGAGQEQAPAGQQQAPAGQEQQQSQ